MGLRATTADGLVAMHELADDATSANSESDLTPDQIRLDPQALHSSSSH